MSKNISKSSSGKYTENFFASKSARDALKTTSKTATQKTAEAASDVTCNKIPDKIIKTASRIILKTVSQSAPRKPLTPMQTEDAILKEMYIPPVKTQ